MEIIGNKDITKQMITILKRELGEELKELKACKKELKKERTKMIKADLPIESIDFKISKKNNAISGIEEELEYYSAKFEPIRVFDAVINLKLLKLILQKTKKFHIKIEKCDDGSVTISWDEKGSKGSYKLNDLALVYKNIIYIPELKVHE